MKKCKADNCNNLVENRIYCSASCRTRTTNLLYKDYKKVSDTIIEKTKLKYKDKKCLGCGSDELSGRRKDRSQSKFCSRSCAAKFNNKKRKESGWAHSPETLEKLKESGFLFGPTGVNRPMPKTVIVKDKPNCVFCGRKVKKYSNKFCSYKCMGAFKTNQLDSSNRKHYRKLCRFNFALNSYPEEFDFELIKRYGWYQAKNRGNNPEGISRDHMFSIADGFKLQIDPEIMRHPANCQLIRNRDNIKKNGTSCITHEELLKRIEDWNSKY